jgi:FSR family fosmidomycin resistance protein-like MFS transporter
MNDAKHKTRTLWLVGLLHGFTHLYHVALLPLYLLIQRDFGFANVGPATALMTVMMLAYFVPSYGLGVLADRVNRRKLLGWGLAINALGFVGLALSPNYACALASVIIAGVGGSFYHPAATAMVARLFPNNTGRALGLVGVGASVGFFIGPLFSGWRAGMLEATRGPAAWRTPVLELGLAGLVVAALFAWLAKDERLAMVVQGDGDGGVAATHASVQPEKLFPTAALWIWFIAAALAFSLRDFAGTSMGSLGSLFLQKAQGYDTRLAGLALSGIFLSSAISNPLFGSLSDSGRGRWTAGLLLTAAVAVAAFPHLPRAWTIPAFLVYGFFFMASYPAVEAALMESVPDAVRGRVFGLFITVGGLIGNLSHWLVGDAVKRMGDGAHLPASYFTLYAVLSGLIMLALAGLPCLHAIRKREHLESAAHAPLNVTRPAVE